MTSRILWLATALMVSILSSPAHQSASLRLAVAADAHSPSPPPAKLVYRMMAGRSAINWTGEDLLKQSTLELKDKFPNVFERIRLDYLGEKCRELEGDVCDTIEITKEVKTGNVITYKVFFRCSGPHIEQKPVDAERIEYAAQKIARLISFHDQKSHPLNPR